MTRKVRGGFSLMEVMLATSILLGSSIILIELANIGRRQANSAYDLNYAQLLCQSKIDEIVAGISPTTAVQDVELDEEPGWLFSVETAPIPDLNLIAVKASIVQKSDDNRRPVEFSIVRWLPSRDDKQLDSLNDDSSRSNSESTTTRLPDSQRGTPP